MDWLTEKGLIGQWAQDSERNPVYAAVSTMLETLEPEADLLMHFAEQLKGTMFPAFADPENGITQPIDTVANNLGTSH